tara:strand:- start:9 stop:314 length:306 start_codon:yes stop_codon:yes gene_type:complete
MEKDIGKLQKNPDTDIIIRVDDFGGKRGLTIREFVNKSESGFTGFTKAGVRIRAENFEEFKDMINSIKKEDLKDEEQSTLSGESKGSKTDDAAGVDEQGLM